MEVNKLPDRIPLFEDFTKKRDKPTRNFNVGDRVRIIGKGSSDNLTGKKGKVTGINEQEGKADIVGDKGNKFLGVSYDRIRKCETTE
ncbi:MAG: hypothetical protein AAF998_11465 [Bacteroidota bacterium]